MLLLLLLLYYQYSPFTVHHIVSTHQSKQVEQSELFQHALTIHSPIHNQNTKQHQTVPVGTLAHVYITLHLVLKSWSQCSESKSTKTHNKRPAESWDNHSACVQLPLLTQGGYMRRVCVCVCVCVREISTSTVKVFPGQWVGPTLSQHAQ